MNKSLSRHLTVGLQTLQRHTLAWLTAGMLLNVPAAMAQPGTAELEPWVQVEMTLFTYENANLDAEVWSEDKLSIGFPDRLVALSAIADMLQLDDWSVLTGTPAAVAAEGSPAASAAVPEAPPVGPKPYAPGDSFTMPDFARDAFHALPPSAHDFVTTNRTLSQSPAHRIVYHSAWRQPLMRRSATPAVGLRGGREFGERSEVEGSVTVVAGSTRDRLTLEANLWLTQFGALAAEASAWTLPVLPAVLSDTDDAEEVPSQAFTPTRIIQFNQSREMRLAQFHYFDHPAMGMLVQITAYERPAPPVVEISVTPDSSPAAQAPAL